MGLQFKVLLPTIDAADPNASDIDHRTLTVGIPGKDPAVITISDLSTVEVLADSAGNPFVGAAGDHCVLSLVDTDGSGNNSPSRDESFTLVDTIAPPQPGDFGAAIVGQTA